MALQGRHGKGTVLPLAIMTSGDTHSPTEDFLRANKYFGAKPSQIQLIKQEKVDNAHDIVNAFVPPPLTLPIIDLNDLSCDLSL